MRRAIGVDPIADIERTYGQRKPLAHRSPIQPRRKTSDDSHETHSRTGSLSSVASTEASTPAATEGETATESEAPMTETETETEIEECTPPGRQSQRHKPLPGAVSPKDSFHGTPTRRQTVSQHDLFHKYFRKDTLLLHHVDLLRYVCVVHALPKHSVC